MGIIHYLDNASTTKLNEEVLKEMLPYLSELFFNASSSNKGAKVIKEKIESARRQCAELIHAETNEVIFTSGATEAINLALKGFFEENFEKGNHLITCKTEHKAVLNTCSFLESRGVEVTYLDVNQDGQISLSDLEDAIRDETSLIALMYVNNETGVIHDIKSISRIAKSHNVCLFCDATQAIGKLEIDVKELGVDLLCMSGHKIGGPKGVGFLYKRNGISLTPLIHGGQQEGQMRGGTYNSPLIIGLGKSCELAARNLAHNSSLYEELSTYLSQKISEKRGILLIANKANRVNCIFNLFIKGLHADVFVSQNERVYVSNGSACTSMIIEGSHVLKAMGFSDEDSNHCLRVSFSPDNTKEDIDNFILEISPIIDDIS